MRILALFCLALSLVHPASLSAQIWPFSLWSHDRLFTLIDENDTFAGTAHNTDNTYTQGLHFRWDFTAFPRSPRFQSAMKCIAFSCDTAKKIQPCDLNATAYGKRPCGMTHLALSETMYTPTDLLDRNANYHDRPYAGYLYGSYGHTLLYPRHLSTTEVIVGVVGRASAARALQSLAHWSWSNGSREPLGWDNQLANAPQLTLRQTYAFTVAQLCAAGACDGTFSERRFFDIVQQNELVVGSLFDRVAAGATVHVGYRFPDLSTPFRIPTTNPPAPSAGKAHLGEDLRNIVRYIEESAWVMMYGSWDARAVGYNGLVSGTYADQGPTGWGTKKQIDGQWWVPEVTSGWAIGVKHGRLSYSKVTRGSEFSQKDPTFANDPKHRFGVYAFTLVVPYM